MKNKAAQELGRLGRGPVSRAAKAERQNEKQERPYGDSRVDAYEAAGLCD